MRTFWYPITKRIFDIIFLAIGLLIVSPLFLLLAILIKREDGGPVFYGGIRVGRNRIPFKIGEQIK